MIQLRWLFIFCTHYFSKWISFERISDQASASTVLRRLPFYLYRDIIGCKKWKGVCMKKETYLSLHPVIFLYGWNPDFSCLNLWSFKEFWADRWFCETTWFNNGSRQGWLRDILWEISPTQSVSTNLFICFPDSDCLTGNFLFPLYEAGSVNSPLYLHGADFIKSSFSCYNYFAGRPLLASFSTPSLRQRYLASSSIALLLLTALSLLFLGIVLYKTLRLRKAQARA